jgi:hypothetical protein
MADVAAVFHWSEAEMDAMDPDVLMDWRGRAIARFKAMNGVEK